MILIQKIFVVFNGRNLRLRHNDLKKKKKKKSRNSIKELVDIFKQTYFFQLDYFDKFL
jgi:hypothetical protein